MKIRIEKLVYGGKGIGKIGDKVCFVPFVLPEEEVEVEILKEKKSFAECKAVSILKESPYRTDPICKYFKYCGGCDYLHIRYEKQVEYKKEILIETLNRIGKLNIDKIDKTFPSERQFNYRNRTQLKIKGEKVGFFMKESREIINIDQCYLLKEDLNNAIEGIRDLLKFLVFQPFEVHLYSSSRDELLVKLLFPRKIRRFPIGLKHLKSFFGKNLTGAGIYRAKGEFPERNILLGKGFTYEDVGNLSFRVSMNSFFQVNRFQVKNLIEAVVDNLEGESFKTVIDLYCGVGTLTIPAGKYAKNVYGIEANPYAVQDANHNKKLNHTPNVRFLNMDAQESIDFINEKNPDLIILDPPRTGLQKQLTKFLVSKKSIKKIIYVSCHPPTFARDLNLLTEGKFSIEKLYMIDMFPQTHHMESIAVLKR
ncbi:class I SAM-dependent RNA methyltransferase [Persephonella sp.]